MLEEGGVAAVEGKGLGELFVGEEIDREAMDEVGVLLPKFCIVLKEKCA